MSEYGRRLPVGQERGGSSVVSFLITVVLIIVAFVVLYYSYNFMFSVVGFPSPDVVIGKAIQTSPQYTGGIPSIRLPYEGGDYTITFWLYVNSNTFVNGGYRKHIVDIGGDTFSTVAIGIDAFSNSLVVRTHTGDSAVTGVSSSMTSSAGGSPGGGSPGVGNQNYVSFGGQTFYGGILPGSTNDATCYSYDLTNGYQPKTGGTADTGCKTLAQLVRAGGPKCTQKGLIDATDKTTNLGWSASCNPCSGYWISPGSGAGGSDTDGGSLWNWWSGLVGSGPATTYVSYSSANPNPCAASCKWSEDGRFSGASTKTFVTGGSPSTGTGGSDTCAESNTVIKYNPTRSSDVLGSPGSTTTTTYSTSSSPACASTTTLSTATMANLFNTAVVAGNCDPPPSCDVPNLDMQRWTCITVVLSGKVTDVYMNGKLSRSCIGSSYFKVDSANCKVNVLKYKRFDGQLSGMNTYNVALNPAQIYELYTRGPGI